MKAEKGDVELLVAKKERESHFSQQQNAITSVFTATR